jgi:hypothetical protein
MRVAGLVGIVLLCASSAQAIDYEIKLVRPVKVGQKYSMTADAAMTRVTKISLAGEKATVQEDGFGVRFEGTAEVLFVNSDGEESKVACTIGKCVRITPMGETEIIPAGRIITATGGKEDTTFTIDQGKLSDEAEQALDLVLRMGEEDGYNDDRIYGTANRQPVGGTWNLDAKASSDEAKADGVKFEPKDITGTLKLEAVEKVGDIECLRIGGDTEIKSLTAKSPEGMKFESGSLKARYGGLYPVDPLMGTLGESLSVTHIAKFSGKNAAGQEAVVESTVQRAAEMKRKFLTK